MNIFSRISEGYNEARHNKWCKYFTVFTRVALAAGFILSGIVKIMGERFTSLSVNHPMGNYLEALHHTGYYYTFIGIVQVTAAILLLIPRTALLGALLYFPIILNICILSLAVRFEGSLLTSPLMVLANLYLLCWDYDRLKYILPFNLTANQKLYSRPVGTSNKFLTWFFAGGITIVIIVVVIITNIFDIMPRNTLTDCQSQCKNSANPSGCKVFCDCIHQKGQPLNQCLDEYHKALLQHRGVK